jgi:phytoene/squalene synthetase
MKHLFDKVSIACSRITTHSYSTSFTLGIRCLDPSLRDPIYAVYGFVRFADEIVDSFHGFDKKTLLDTFKRDTYLAINDRISLNPILNSFQATVHQYQINHDLIELFLKSMEMDLDQKSYDEKTFKEYILGSAEVVGLMCLHIFCNRDLEMFEKLKPHAMSLGSAFQKINFLRDLREDYIGLGRLYFPGIEMEKFNETKK